MPHYRAAYPPEFRRQIVELVRSGRTPEELAREFEPTAQSISTWVKQAEPDAGKRVDGPTSAERGDTERLKGAGIEPSVGSVGDSCDNALAETINGLYKAEVIWRRGRAASSRSSSPRSNGSLGSTINDCWSQSEASRRPKPKRAIVLLCATQRVSHGGVTQTKWPPAKPGRFNDMFRGGSLGFTIPI